MCRDMCAVFLILRSCLSSTLSSLSAPLKPKQTLALRRDSRPDRLITGEFPCCGSFDTHMLTHTHTHTHTQRAKFLHDTKFSSDEKLMFRLKVQRRFISALALIFGNMKGKYLIYTTGSTCHVIPLHTQVVRKEKDIYEPIKSPFFMWIYIERQMGPWLAFCFSLR